MTSAGRGAFSLKSANTAIGSEVGKPIEQLKMEARKQIYQATKFANDMVTEIEDLSSQVVDLSSQVANLSSQLEEEREGVADDKEKIATLEWRVAQLEARKVDQGAFAKAAVRKVFQTIDCGNLLVEFGKGTFNLGKYLVLEDLLEECPKLKLQQRRFGWDLHARTKFNIIQQVVLKGDHKFKLLEAIASSAELLTAAQVEKMSIDYDGDLDEQCGEIPSEYNCEDEGLSLYVSEGEKRTDDDGNPLLDDQVSSREKTALNDDAIPDIPSEKEQAPPISEKEESSTELQASNVD